MPARITGESSRARFPRYRALREIARGGMGVVHEVKDLASGRRLALKELAGEETALDRRRFESEIRLLSVLDHESIVRLQDVGRGEDSLFYTMELLRGLPLERVLDSPLPGRDEIDWSVGVVARLLEALEHVHRAGFVHRDLKAGNVMVLHPQAGSAPLDPRDLLALDAPAVKLFDFGLATPLGDFRREEHEGGTALYMAPERAAEGYAADRRSDLYSVGVLLYRLVTRRYPWERLGEALSSDRSPPAPPHALNDACPRELSEIITRQLSREPRERSASAGGLRRELICSVSLEERFPPRVFAPTYYGRGDDRDAIDAGLRRALFDGPRVLLVSGVRGSGRSWLLRRSGFTALAALESGYSCFVGEYARGGPLRQGVRQALASLLAEVADRCELDRLRERLAPWGGILLDELALAPAVAERVEILRADSPPSKPTKSACRDLIVESARRLVTFAAETFPVVLVLDNLDRAEEMDLALVRRVATSKRARVAIVATCSSESSGALYSAWLEEMSGRDDFERIELEALGDSEVERLAASMLETPARAGPELVRTLVEDSRGLPGLVEGAVRDLWSQGRIAREGRHWELVDADGDDVGDADPVGAALPPRLETLSDADRRVLAAASVLDEPFDPRHIAPLLEAGEMHGDAVRRLVDAGALEVSDLGVRFVAPIVRSFSAGLVDAATRAKWHRLLAELALGSGHEASEHAWLSAARHFEQGGEYAQAGELFLKFARRARDRGARRRSLAAYERALSVLSSTESRSQAFEEKAAIHGLLGDHTSALACLKSAAEGRREGIELLPLLCEEGKILHRQGDFRQALEVFERCRGIAEGDAEWEVRVLLLLGSVRFDLGEMNEASEIFERGFGLAEANSDHVAMANALFNRGMIEKRRGNTSDAIAYIERAILSSEQAGRDAQVAQYLHNLANLYRSHGDWGRAIESLERALELRERLGDRRGIAICLNNLCRTVGARGDNRRALELAEQALEIFREVADKRGVMIVNGNIGSFLYYSGRVEEARGIFTENLELARRLRNPRGEADSLFCLGRIELLRGNSSVAEQLFRDGLRSLPEFGDADLRAVFCAELAVSRLRLGNREGAADALREGWEFAGGVSDQQHTPAGWLHVVASKFHLEYDDVEAALESAQRAVEVLDRDGWRYDAGIAHRQLARAYRELGPDWVDRTEEHLRLSRTIFEELENDVEVGRSSLDEAELWSLLEEDRDAIACLEDAIERFESAGETGLAERARAQLKEISR